MNRPIANDITPLSDEDVEVLHSIIHQAQLLPGNPFGEALFRAYDTVLSQRGIDYDNGQVYFRFLLRMVANRSDEDTLRTRFETLLAEQGIQIEVDEDNSSVGEITREINGGLDGTRTESPGHEAPIHPRRVSDTSLYDGTAANLHGIENGTDVPPPPYEPRKPPRRRSSSRTTDPTSDRTRSREPGVGLLSRLPFRGRVKGRAASDSIHNRNKRSASVSSQGSISIQRQSRIPIRDQPPHFADESSTLSTLDSSNVSDSDGPQNGHAVIPELLEEPSQTTVLQADNFRQRRVSQKFHMLLESWRAQAIWIRQKRLKYEEIAFRYDRGKTLLSAFSELHHRFRARVEERKHFQEVEQRRADKLYDLYLKNKAFTHWLQHALDQVSNTHLARRHVLRKTYFSAWKDLTVVNELKVRRQGVKKYLKLWRRRTAAVQVDESRAVETYEDNLVQRTFRAWFRRYNGRKAEFVAEDSLKRRYFGRWLQITRERLSAQVWAEQFRTNCLRSQTWQLWMQKMQVLRDGEHLAADTRQRMLLAQSLRFLGIQSALHPVARQLSTANDDRLKRKAFAIWSYGTRLSIQANQVNEQRIKHNAFHDWNDNLRIRALAWRIDDRVIKEALYRWIMAARAARLTRAHEERLKRSVLHSLFVKLGVQSTRLTTATHCFQRSQRTIMLRDTLRRLGSVAEDRVNDERSALSFYRQRLKERVLGRWHFSHEYLQDLNQKASLIEFYILGTTMLKRWKEATSEHQRQRRREAYTIVRRRIKFSLAREMLGRWRQKTAHVMVKERTANESAENKTLRTSNGAIGRWRERTAVLTDNSNQATVLRRAKLLTTAFRAWTARMQRLQVLEGEAANLQNEIFADSMANCLRKWNWRLFQVNRQEDNALALRDRTFEKHARNMIRHWAERTAMTLQQRGVHLSPVHQYDDAESDREPSPSPMPYQQHPFGANTPAAQAPNINPLDASVFNLRDLDLRLNNYPDLDLDLIPEGAQEAGLLTSTPLPGYMRTPSKRSTARAKARERIAAVQPTPFFTSRTHALVFPPPSEAASRAGSPSALRRSPHRGDRSALNVSFVDPEPEAGPSYTPAPVGSITPFRSRLRAGGYSERRLGTRGRTPGSGALGRSLGGRARGRGTFGGFEDIVEDESGEIGRRRGE